jgi:hypothetical protein
MISLKCLIVEGRYDSLVTKLSNKLLGIIKDSYAATQTEDGKFAGKKIYYTKKEDAPHIEGADDDGSDLQPEIYFEEIEALDIPLEFYLTLKVQWIKELNDYRYGGDAYNDTSKDPADAETPPLIEVRFMLDPAEYPQLLSELSMDLKDILRHEIEHTTQSGWNVMQSKYLRSDMDRRNKIDQGEIEKYKYWLLQKEQPAMIQGLYTKAKKSRMPFAQVVNDHLNIWVRDGVITDEQRETILNRWRKMLPKLGIRQEL